MLSPSELGQLNQPAQYSGAELNSIDKTGQVIDLNFCLAFPDTYEVGMSHVGMQILYDVINRNRSVWAQRVYQPEADMEQLLRKKGLALSSLEGKKPLNEFDIVGFSLQYELCMHGILNILDLGKIPLLSKDRKLNDPLIIGGGPVAYHPEPFADFFDAFLIGDGEELVPEFIAKFQELKKTAKSRSELLTALSTLKSVYVPALFEPIYDTNGNFHSMRALKADYQHVQRRVLATLENAPFPTKPIVPNVKAVHDRLSVEVMRGCVRGCRFCQAGYLYRPQRERKPEEIMEIVDASLKSTGFEELSLLSLSTADYCSILPVLSSLKDRFAKENELVISFPSTRVDALTPELLQEVQSVRRSGFTVAPEAGTQRLRDVINKGVTEEELLELSRNVFKLGWNSIKLYFMIGLPTETDQDVLGIIELGRKVKEIAGKHATVTVSVSTHVPKPHTPFQWAEQISVQETRRKHNLLAHGLKQHRIGFRYHTPESSFLEGVFARGDRKLGQVILKAYQLGCRLNGWVEKLQANFWQQAFTECNINPEYYLREREDAEYLPWEHISCDIPKSYFLKGWRKAKGALTTQDCLTASCSSCKACNYDTTRNVLFDRVRTEKRLNIIDPAWQPIIAKRAAGQTTDLLEIQNLPTLNSPLPITGSTPAEQGTYQLKEYLKTESGSTVYRTRHIPAIQRIRVCYSKTGPARFYGHLNLASVFFRAGRRANLPIAFSQGFNPKPKFQFGPPLQLGLESVSEYVDIFLTKECQPELLISQLNTELPEGIKVLSARNVDLKVRPLQAEIAAQNFRVTSLTKFSMLGEWHNLTLTRRRKRKEQEVKLSDYIALVENQPQQLLFTLLQNGSAGTLKPTEVAETLTGIDLANLQITKVGIQTLTGTNV